MRELATTLGELLEREPVFSGHEAETALLSDASRCRELFGPPSVPATEIAKMVAEWVKSGGVVLDKPTRYEVRDGEF